MTAASGWNEMRTAGPTGVVERVIGGMLLFLLVIGSFALWVGVPALVLWGLGALTDDSAQHLILGLIAVPLGMVLFGLVLAVLNNAYLRAAGISFPTSDDESQWRPRLRGPLDRIIGVSAVICLVAFFAWLVLGSAGTMPAGP